MQYLYQIIVRVEQTIIAPPPSPFTYSHIPPSPPRPSIRRRPCLFVILVISLWCTLWESLSLWQLFTPEKIICRSEQSWEQDTWVFSKSCASPLLAVGPGLLHNNLHFARQFCCFTRQCPVPPMRCVQSTAIGCPISKVDNTIFLQHPSL